MESYTIRASNETRQARDAVLSIESIEKRKFRLRTRRLIYIYTHVKLCSMINLNYVNIPLFQLVFSRTFSFSRKHFTEIEREIGLANSFIAIFSLVVSHPTITYRTPSRFFPRFVLERTQLHDTVFYSIVEFHLEEIFANVTVNNIGYSASRFEGKEKKWNVAGWYLGGMKDRT